MKYSEELLGKSAYYEEYSKMIAPIEDILDKNPFKTDSCKMIYNIKNINSYYTDIKISLVLEEVDDDRYSYGELIHTILVTVSLRLYHTRNKMIQLEIREEGFYIPRIISRKIIVDFFDYIESIVGDFDL